MNKIQRELYEKKKKRYKVESSTSILGGLGVLSEDEEDRESADDSLGALLENILEEESS